MELWLWLDMRCTPSGDTSQIQREWDERDEHCCRGNWSVSPLFDGSSGRGEVRVASDRKRCGTGTASGVSPVEDPSLGVRDGRPGLLRLKWFMSRGRRTGFIPETCCADKIRTKCEQDLDRARQGWEQIVYCCFCPLCVITWTIPLIDKRGVQEMQPGVVMDLVAGDKWTESLPARSCGCGWTWEPL